MATKAKALILIVDDSPKNVQVLGKTLHSIGYNIAVANSGFQALSFLENELPDLILLDIQMPEMDGFEVCQKIKENPKTFEIPVIFLTAVTDSSQVVKGFESGAVDYITKPFNFSELTARVATHLEIKKSREELFELNAMKDKFFRILAHDLRNPFVGIIGLSENAEKILKNSQIEGMDKVFKYTQIIHSSAISAAKLLENLLDWAKSQSGMLEFNPRSIDLPQLFSNNIELIRGMAVKKEISIIVSESEEEVFADESMLNTILRNLLTNAVKFSEKGGEIFLSSRKMGDGIEVSVQDTGVGIDSLNIEKIFRIDSKFTSLGTEKEKGTGLGLLLCREFVERHGGKIWLTSVKGKGTKITFTIPRNVMVEKYEK